MFSTQTKFSNEENQNKQSTFKSKLNQAKLLEKTKPKIMAKIEELERKLGMLNTLEQKIMTIENSRIQSRGNEDSEEIPDFVDELNDSPKINKKKRDPNEEEILLQELYKIIKQSQAE